MRSLLVALAASAVVAPAAEAARPTACFTQSPSSAVVGQPVTFDSSCSSDPDPGDVIASRAWDLDNSDGFDDGTGVTATRSFATAGRHRVRLRVRDNSNDQDTVARVVTVTVNSPPTASFTHSPAAPAAGEAVTFTSTSTDSDGTIASYAWALDADGAFDDGTGSSVSRTFTTPGEYAVALRVTDNNGGESIARATITVGNRLPVAAFDVSPAAPSSGQEVTFSSTSADPDGTIVSYAWALDGDGAFDDGAESSVARTFTTPGNYTVALRVTDDRGATSVATQTIVVGAPPGVGAPGAPGSDPEPGQIFDTSTPVSPGPSSGPQANPVEPLRWLSPFPTVRLRGRTTRTGVRVSLFTVRAPGNSVVIVRCSGGSCPAKTLKTKVTARRSTALGTTRIRRMERSLRAGTVLQVYVTKKGMVGKYTRFKIRSVAVPTRRDRCLMPGSTRPVGCPSR